MALAGGRPVFYQRRLDPHRRPDDRGWFDVELDLSEYAGQRIEVELGARCEQSMGATLEMGGFELPRLVVRPGAARLDAPSPLWQP